jgi:squalene-hopene/tetraprenyl-beta-curcumene cyclase
MTKKLLSACCAAALLAAACAESPAAPRAPISQTAPAASPAPGGSTAVSAANGTAWQERAANYLDGRVRDDLDHPIRIAMLEQRTDCAANCHTTLPYLMARPLLPGGDAQTDRVREAVRARLAGVSDWATAKPWFEKSDKIIRWSRGAEAVVDAAALVDADLARGGPLSPESTRALALMWSHQRDDGAWDWFGFGLEPWETSDDCGAAVAATLTARLPGPARDAARPHVERLLRYVRERLADTAHSPALHQKVNFLWASAAWPELLDEGTRRGLAEQVVARQRPDGGWSLATWGGGDLADPNGASDGYATAIASLALCEGKLGAASVERGLRWLERSQSADGSWPGRSVNEHKKILDTFETDMATSYAVLALSRCR